jgi:hypothetical protein
MGYYSRIKNTDYYYKLNQEQQQNGWETESDDMGLSTNMNINKRTPTANGYMRAFFIIALTFSFVSIMSFLILAIFGAYKLLEIMW